MIPLKFLSASNYFVSRSFPEVVCTKVEAEILLDIYIQCDSSQTVVVVQFRKALCHKKSPGRLDLNFL